MNIDKVWDLLVAGEVEARLIAVVKPKVSFKSACLGGGSGTRLRPLRIGAV